MIDSKSLKILIISFVVWISLFRQWLSIQFVDVLYEDIAVLVNLFSVLFLALSSIKFRSNHLAFPKKIFILNVIISFYIFFVFISENLNSSFGLSSGMYIIEWMGFIFTNVVIVLAMRSVMTSILSFEFFLKTLAFFTATLLVVSVVYDVMSPTDDMYFTVVTGANKMVIGKCYFAAWVILLLYKLHTSKVNFSHIFGVLSFTGMIIYLCLLSKLRTPVVCMILIFGYSYGPVFISLMRNSKIFRENLLVALVPMLFIVCILYVLIYAGGSTASYAASRLFAPSSVEELTSGRLSNFILSVAFFYDFVWLEFDTIFFGVGSSIGEQFIHYFRSQYPIVFDVPAPFLWGNSYAPHSAFTFVAGAYGWFGFLCLGSFIYMCTRALRSSIGPLLEVRVMSKTYYRFLMSTFFVIFVVFFGSDVEFYGLRVSTSLLIIIILIYNVYGTLMRKAAF